jgi:hypothetical protein
MERAMGIEPTSEAWEARRENKLPSELAAFTGRAFPTVVPALRESSRQLAPKH